MHLFEKFIKGTLAKVAKKLEAKSDTSDCDEESTNEENKGLCLSSGFVIGICFLDNSKLKDEFQSFNVDCLLAMTQLMAIAFDAKIVKSFGKFSLQ